MVMGDCIACGAMIQYNPHYVPSIRVEGKREAVCRGCFKRWNDEHRVKKDLKPIELDPRAYEPLDEHEL